MPYHTLVRDSTCFFYSSLTLSLYNFIQFFTSLLFVSLVSNGFFYFSIYFSNFPLFRLISSSSCVPFPSVSFFLTMRYYTSLYGERYGVGWSLNNHVNNGAGCTTKTKTSMHAWHEKKVDLHRYIIYLHCAFISLFTNPTTLILSQFLSVLSHCLIQTLPFLFIFLFYFIYSAYRTLLPLGFLYSVHLLLSLVLSFYFSVPGKVWSEVLNTFFFSSWSHLLRLEIDA